MAKLPALPIKKYSEALPHAAALVQGLVGQGVPRAAEAAQAIRRGEFMLTHALVQAFTSPVPLTAPIKAHLTDLAYYDAMQHLRCVELREIECQAVRLAVEANERLRQLNNNDIRAWNLATGEMSRSICRASATKQRKAREAMRTCASEIGA